MFAPLLFAASWPVSLTCVIFAPQIAEVVCGEVRDPQSADAILVEWERHTPSIERALVELTCYQYDEAFAIEERCRVTLHFEPGSRYLYRIAPVALPDDAVSTKQDVNQEPYQLTTCSRATWYADTQSVMQIEHSTKTYGIAEFPPGASPGDLRMLLDPQPPNLIESFWSWLSSSFGLHAALATGTQVGNLRSRLTWSLGPQSDADRLHLIAKPQGSAARHFERLEVLLNSTTFDTVAYRFVAPGGSKQFVYVVQQKQLNDAAPILSRPDLRGYGLHARSSNRTPEAPDVKDVASRWRPFLVRTLLMWIGIWW